MFKRGGKNLSVQKTKELVNLVHVMIYESEGALVKIKSVQKSVQSAAKKQDKTRTRH